MRAKLLLLTTRLSGLTALAASAGYSAFALADNSGGIASLATSWGSTAQTLSTTIGQGVFLLGIVTALGAALKFKAHGEDPRQTPLKICLIYAFAAAAMIGLPTMLGVGVGTLFGSSASVVDGSGSALTVKAQ